ncbi:MAG: hypothetical protein NUV49_02265 [Patescibacteria group bacterium]|nr:hypothetical protein [Patescibacteria group bacterium]
MFTKRLIIILVVIIAVLALGFLFVERSTPEEDHQESEYALLFGNQLQTLGVLEVGQPIEGFDAFMLKSAFPGLVPEDFNGVETIEGHYELINGLLEYKRDKGQPITSAEQTVSMEGYDTLLRNLSLRLGVVIESEESVQEIIKRIVPDEGTPPVNQVFTCTLEQRNAEVCAQIYQPVCATVNIQCITTPCDPIQETFSNACSACSNPLVSSYTVGECLSR